MKTRKSFLSIIVAVCIIVTTLVPLTSVSAATQTPVGNLAYGVTPTFGNFSGPLSTSNFQQANHIPQLTSGSLNSDNWVSTGLSTIGPAYMQIDLGSVKAVNDIKTWQYYKSPPPHARSFYQAVQISTDATNWTTVYNNDSTDAGGLKSLGKNLSGDYNTMTYETVNGNDIPFSMTDVRYVRFWSAGFIWDDTKAYGGNQPLWVQLEVFNNFKVTIDPNYAGSTTSIVSVPTGTTVSLPETPVNPNLGYVFAGWTLNGSPYHFTTPVTADITLQASWNNVGTSDVTFNYNDDVTAPSVIQVTNGNTVTMPQNPKRSGYNFAGWRVNGVPYNTIPAITSDITLSASWVPTQTANAFKISMGAVNMYLNGQGQITNMVSTINGQDYVPVEHGDAYIISLIANSTSQKPTSMIFDSATSTLKFTFATINTQVDVKVTNKGDYTTFTVSDLIAPPSVHMETLLWGPIKTTISSVVGGALGVVYDHDFAIGIHDLNDKTIGGWPQEWADLTYPPGYTKQDNTYLSGMSWQAQAAVVAPFGSFLQSFTNDYTRPTTRIVGGFAWVNNDKVVQTDFSMNSYGVIAKELVPALINSAYPEDASIVGSSIALFGSKSTNILNTIESIELGEGLPHPTVNGQWQKTAPAALASEISTGNLNTSNVDRVTKAAADAGISYVYNIVGAVGPYDHNGSFRFNGSWGHSDQAAKTQMSDVAAKYGVYLGSHTMADYIGHGGDNDTLYVTTYGANPDLANAQTTVLTRPVSASDTTIYVADASLFGNIVRDAPGKYIRIGSEVIQYTGATQIGANEWQVTGATRGARGTGAFITSYSTGATVARLWLSQYSAFLGGESISKQIAMRAAQAFNDSGIRDISLDGLEDIYKNGYMQLALNQFSSTVYNNLINKDNFYLVNSILGANQWDILAREGWNGPVTSNVPNFNLSAPSDQADPVTDSRAYMMQRNLLNQLYRVGIGSIQQTGRELSLVAALDAGFGTGSVENLTKAHLASIKAWKDAMVNNAFSQQQKQNFLNAYNADRSNSWLLTTITAGKEWTLQQTNSSGSAIGSPIALYAGGNINIESRSNGNVATNVSMADVTGINPAHTNKLAASFAGEVAFAAHTGETVIVSPQANNGYVLGSITVTDASGNDVPVTLSDATYGNYSFTMPNGDVTITPVFERAIAYNVIADSSVSNGAITMDLASASNEQIVSVIATPAAGYKLVPGSVVVKDDSNNTVTTNASNQFIMPANDVIVTAQFAPVSSNNITIDTDIQNGSISVALSAKEGDKVTVTATSEAKYKFQQVTVYNASGDVIIVDNYADDATFTMPASDVTVTASFIPTNTVTIASGISNGTLIVNKANAANGDNVVVSITPAQGYKMVPGSLIALDAADAGVPLTVTADQSKYDFTMPASAVTVTAQFVASESRTLTTTISNGTVTLTKTTANINDPVSFTVTPNAGYKISSVYVLDSAGDPVALTDNRAFLHNSYLVANASASLVSGTFTMPDANVSVNAYTVEMQNPTITGITAPAPITGVANGTAKTAEALGLPKTVELVTDTAESLNANVTWDVNASSYDPSLQTGQTFTVNGTVTLPDGIENPNNVALTTSISVTVLPGSAPQATLTSQQQVIAGEALDLTMGLSNVTQSEFKRIHAKELTLTYDSANMELGTVTSLVDGLKVIDQKETEPGHIRIILASLNPNGFVPQGNLLKFRFTAKAVTQVTNTAFGVSNITIANGLGNEMPINGASSGTQIIVPSVPVDKTLLNTLITSAQVKHDAAVEGNKDGQYLTGSKAILQLAIDNASVTTNDPNATQVQVDNAKVTLEEAVQAFENKKITADVSGNGTVSIGDLGIVAGAYGTQQGQAGWNMNADVNKDGKVDIVDLAIVAEAIIQ